MRLSPRFIKALPRLCLLLLSLPGPLPVLAEDGYSLWLRNAPLSQAASAAHHRYTTGISAPDRDSATLRLAIAELHLGLRSLFGSMQVPATNSGPATIMIARRDDLELADSLKLPFEQLGSEGFLIKQQVINGIDTLLVSANSDIGLLYGSFELLRQFQLQDTFNELEIVSAPAIQLRVLNHWDNLDRSVERGYAGESIWDWWRLPDYVDPRYTAYARANASVGINGTVLNNVNSNAQILSSRYLQKVAAIADVMRPWGIRVYLSARFSAPQELGGLSTSDPLNPEVSQWWRNKVDEIYNIIPDFGGFLVKANSEGQPGPQDFGRNHADGANLLANALAPHKGVVMWRAFVYSDINPEDRHKQAYSEFKPLDGQFADNVIIQVKNGAIDFQPREPFHPMFGAFPQTPLMMEFQITKEYLGFATHLAYLGPMWEEVLQADTYAEGEGSLVAKVIDGSLHEYKLTGIAGVSGIGRDRDWQGSDFNQANWYAFARLAWNPLLNSESIARDWLRLTFSDDEHFIAQAANIMMRSREALVNYMTPLGLAHLMGTGHHYGPAPWVDSLGRPEWNPYYYHRADANGIGVDRTASGTDALQQYAPEVAAAFGDPASVDEKFLLWFHHLPWTHEMSSGNSLWQALLAHYDQGVDEAEAMRAQWQTLVSYIDAERFDKTTRLLSIQVREAQWWRDACIAYFQSVSGLDLPEGHTEPEHSLDYYQALSFPNAP